MAKIVIVIMHNVMQLVSIVVKFKTHQILVFCRRFAKFNAWQIVPLYGMGEIGKHISVKFRTADFVSRGSKVIS